MAGDWIKMRKTLPADPRIVRMMSALQADRFRTIGGVFSAWCLFDEHTEDGHLDGYTPEVFDDVVGLDGLARAMESVGWLEIGDGYIVAPRFSEHNGKTARRRLQDSVRKTSAREADKKRKCPPTREEKRREEKSNPIPASSGDDGGSGSCKSKRPSAKEKARGYTDDFERFWSAYWNKSAKAPAFDAFKTAIRRIIDDTNIPKATDSETALRWLIYRTDLYASQLTEATEKLHASTYLNQDRFSDELKDHRDPVQMGYDTVKRKK